MKTIYTIFVFQLFFIISFVFAQENITTLVTGKVYKEKLLKNQKHGYKINLNKGEFFEMTVMQKGVDVVIDLFSPTGTLIKTFDAPNGKNGPERVELSPESDGSYRFEIYPLNDQGAMTDSMKSKWEETNQGDYEISSVIILHASDYQKKLAAEKIRQQNIITSLKEYLHPLKTVDAGSGFEDLVFLKPLLNDVQFVGLGEATHGTREFFRMKHRMLEFLVEEMGFTVFAIEASFAGCNNINEYVLNGTGDAHTALASQGFWTWDTEEVIDMIEWIRQHNIGADENKKVKFLGFDIQINSKGGGFDIVQNYLKKVDPARAEQTDSLFLIFKRMDKMDTKDINLDSLKKEFYTLLSFITMSKGLYIQKSSKEEYEFVLQHANTIGQLFDAYFINDKDIRKNERDWRDYYMASNFEYLVEQEKPGTKFVIWAHNSHIAKNEDNLANTGTKPFGSYLKNSYGNKYYAFGFSFSKGSYQAIEFTPDNKSKGLQEFTVGSAKENSLDWYFEQTGYPEFIIDFRDQQLPKIVKEFSQTELQTRGSGAISVRDFIENNYGFTTISKDFDGMIFINNTTRSRPTPTGMRK